jgi:hypothetical protein
MRRLLACAGIALGCALAGYSGARAESCDSPCPATKTICAPAANIVVEVPAPNITVRQSAPVCAAHESGLQRCCWNWCKPAAAQPVVMQAYTAAPVSYQPISMAPAPVSYQPMMAPAPVNFQPISMAPAPVNFQPMMAPAPVNFQPISTYSPAPVATFQPLSVGAYQPMAAPQSITLTLPVSAAPAPTAPAPTAPDTSTDVNQALRRVTAQIKTLTDAVDKHTYFLKVHEQRITSMETYLKDPTLKLPKLYAVPDPMPEEK